MSREIPEPVRAAAGLAAIVLDEVRKLPGTLPGIPVRAIGLAMQAALKVQQEYAGFVARGDELFTGIRGEAEPGLATFDDDVDDAPAAGTGYRESAFDRAEAPAPDADVTAAAVVDLDEAAGGDQSAWQEALEEDALEELAIEELVDAGAAPAADADAIENALLESDAASAAEGAPTATATDEGGTPVAAATGGSTDTGTAVSSPKAPATAPVDGYDDLTIAQLRGRLRGYALSTVEALVAYEEANRAREPYLRLMRNRLERLTAQEVEASPLTPRGA